MTKFLLKLQILILNSRIWVLSHISTSFVWILIIILSIGIFISAKQNLAQAEGIASNNSVYISPSIKNGPVCSYLSAHPQASVTGCGYLVSETSGPEYQGLVGAWMLYSIDHVVGERVSMTNVTENGTTLAYDVYAGGLGEGISNTIGTMYESKPVDNGYYASNIIDNINPIQSVQAQATTTSTTSQNIVPTGRSILNIIANVHSAVLNFVFIIYAFVFIIIAFAIMLRQKLSGSAYVSVINSIPRIIISLILVIFSYPIAAAVIDLGYLSMNVLYDSTVNSITWNFKTSDTDATGTNMKLKDFTGTIKGVKKDDFVKELAPTSPSMNVFQVFGHADVGNIAASGSSIELAPMNLGSGTMAGFASALGKMFQGLLGASFNAVSGDASSGVNVALSPIIVLVISVAALFAAFKLFFALLKEFLNILFYPLAAPIMFALYAMPGNDKMISNWFKTYIGSIAVFVAIYGLFLMIVMLANGVVLTGSNSWNPFLVGFLNTPTIGALSSLIAYGLFIISPQIPEMVKKAVGSSGSGLDKYTKTIREETSRAAARVTMGAVGG